MQFKEAGQCRGWVFQSDWHRARNASMHHISVAHDDIGLLNMMIIASSSILVVGDPHIHQGSIDNANHRFVDKDVLAVTIESGFIEGEYGVMYSACEVYPYWHTGTLVRAYKLCLLMN